jgi:hypothetical protein
VIFGDWLQTDFRWRSVRFELVSDKDDNPKTLVAKASNAVAAWATDNLAGQ